MSNPMEPATSRRDAQFTINPTAQAAADAVRERIQRREEVSAEMILAAPGMEESDD